MTSVTVAERRDLRELESVTVGGRSLVATHFVGGSVAAALAAGLCSVAYTTARWWLTGAWPERPERLMALAAIGAIALVLVLVTGLRMAYLWRTDREGYTVRSLTRQLFIPWSQVTSAFVTVNKLGMRRYIIRTEMGALNMPRFHMQAGFLPASIWQHLRRLGRGDDSLLTPAVQTLWTPIPDSVPQEVEWVNATPPRWQSTVLVLAALVAVTIAMWVYDPTLRSLRHGASVLHLAFAFIPHFVHGLYRQIATARSAAVRGYGIEARTALRKVSFSWQDVRTAAFAPDSLTVIARGSMNRVVLPFKLGDDTSVQLVLSALRRLRSVEQPVPLVIPEPLRSSAYLKAAAPSLESANQVVELRAPWFLTVLVVFAALGALAIAWHISLIGSLPTAVRYGILIWIGLGGLCLPIILTASVRADGEGITRRTLLRTRTVSWREVAIYSVRPIRGYPGMYRRVLKSASGQVLMDLSSVIGSLEDRTRLEAFMDAKLAGIRRDEGG